MPVPSLDDITALPKLELHLHLEGCISLETIAQLCRSKGIDVPNSLDDVYPTHDLSLFLAGLDWVCGLVTNKDQVADLVKDFGRYCLEQNIIYCELIVNPTHWGGMHYSELLVLLADSFAQLYRDIGVDIYLLPSILRQQTREQANELAAWIVEQNHERIAGISVDGNEKTAGPTGEKFSEAYAQIRKAGLKCTAHAGESSGAEGVRSALDDLNVHRIDHGVRVIEDESLTERVASEGVPLNVCVSSNCHLLYDGAQNHPFMALKERGVLMTLNTDDPVVLKTTLSKELYWVAQEFNLSLQDIAEFQKNAVRAAFCPDARKQQLLVMLDA